ncbi:hypothetical protein J2T04_002336 [Chryseobacterium lathyri]|uniref:Uncharacterized protein n=1 Tax=Chryseobacterium lathyri TaxID=395933 RepID=A0ABT9SLY3_9FLAO|nr:hypothetical protein [Chryseobacterium lathyri]MDQ0067302.1 hypothetical protein [Chryseobacterium lathyri]
MRNEIDQNNRTVTGITEIPEAVHQINKLQIAKVSCLKK